LFAQFGGNHHLTLGANYGAIGSHEYILLLSKIDFQSSYN
jgi:hypothetical protein